MLNPDLIPTLLFSQSSYVAESTLNTPPTIAVDSAIAVTALVTVLLTLPVLLRLIYKQAKTQTQTIDGFEAAARHFLPYYSPHSSSQAEPLPIPCSLLVASQKDRADNPG